MRTNRASAYRWQKEGNEMNTIAVATLIDGGQQLFSKKQIVRLFASGEQIIIDFCRKNRILSIDEYRMDGQKVANIISGKFV